MNRLTISKNTAITRYPIAELKKPFISFKNKVYIFVCIRQTAKVIHNCEMEKKNLDAAVYGLTACQPVSPICILSPNQKPYLGIDTLSIINY